MRTSQGQAKTVPLKKYTGAVDHEFIFVPITSNGSNRPLVLHPRLAVVRRAERSTGDDPLARGKVELAGGIVYAVCYRLFSSRAERA